MKEITTTNALYLQYMGDHHPELLEGIPAEIVAKCSARWNKKGNTKVGDMWTFSTTYGNIAHYIPGFGCEIVGTCGKHCAGCLHACYVASSYRYPSVRLGHARNTVAIRKDIAEAERALDGYIVRARKKPKVCRFDQSGEIECMDELIMFCNLARKHPEIKFYVYTKAFDFIVPALLAGAVPLNLIVNISIWHEYGIDAWNAVKHLPNVRAFVVVDKEWTPDVYASHGIIIEVMCPAYDEDGNLNHKVPCNACGLCFDPAKPFKVIGCYEH